MAGVQALHDRFGKLPFSSLFDPAIWIAENGVPFSPLVEAWLKQAGPFVTRLPEAKRVFTRENGEFYKAGELFRQPELAETLKRTASEGSTYIYKGDWARNFVDAVRREGGKMTMEDLAAYQPLWSEPAEATYDRYQILSPGVPNLGGRLIQWSLGLAEAADLKQYPHYTKSSQSLYFLMEISRRAQELAYSKLPATRANIASQWSRILAGMKTPSETPDTTPHHSAGVIAVDADGNVACLLHSINTQLWGSTGIFVDGVSIPDSATFQQQIIASTGPGQRLPETTNPLIVLRDGKPVLAATAIGSGLHQAMLQNLVNILDFGMDPKTSVDTPNTQGPYFGNSATGPAKPDYSLEAVAEGDFPESVLDGVRARGRAIKVLPKTDRSQPGYWIGVQIDPKTRKMHGAAISTLPSLVEAF
jgi:gamma-glutamyltranspeptidase/glutathione hydrolase